MDISWAAVARAKAVRVARRLRGDILLVYWLLVGWWMYELC